MEKTDTANIDAEYSIIWYSFGNNEIIEEITVLSENAIYYNDSLYKNVSKDTSLDMQYLQKKIGISIAQVKIVDKDAICFLVEPVDGSPLWRTGNLFTVTRKPKDIFIEADVGEVLEITYSGTVDTFPGRFVHVYDVQVLKSDN